ncbi:helix-turn-helix domain-containing protein [Streptomyces sp. SID13726]|uniref:helix-turn-helix domain-containing protein n=1 Tax=Streptomyces sp. SID13726 TaxID=2706058 RepID=UPI0013BB0D34|nr:helix-turn-helix domain-containing protein [Streptomyces sp. SID13726]NEA98739.1 helix-turn-helix domain-containing protein [Streptomyces sp. SID13726]
MAGRPRDTVLLTEEERATLLAWTRSRTCSQARALRARIVLACEDEPTNTAVAGRLGVSRDMVGKWRARFHAERLAGLDEQPRSGRPPTADDDTVAHVLVRTLTPAPPGARQSWSTRSMAAETGLSQSTVNRIGRTYRVRPGVRAAAGPRRAWSLPDHAEEVVGLFLAPPVCVLAVTAPAGGRPVRNPAATAVGRLFGQDREAPHVLAVACAFAVLRGRPDTPWTDHSALRAFLDRVRAATGGVVHLLAHGVPAEIRDALTAPDAAPHTRPRWHLAPGAAEWTDETQRLLAADSRLSREAAPDVPRLRDALLTWSTTWTASAAPFTRIAAPRPRYDVPAICGPGNDSNAPEARAPGGPTGERGSFPDAPPGAPVTTDPVVGRLREAVLAGGYRPGDRVREAPLAARFDLSRRGVRAGLHALAEEGLLELLPGGATAVPAITVKDVLDLYALRASLGALLIRRVAMLGPDNLAQATAALAEVRAAARDKDHARIREVDLWYQDALARTADLPQAAGTFERLTARLRMFVTVLDMDYSQAFDTITNEDAAVHDALLAADGNEAARLWRVKIERCVRYMIAQLPEDDVAPHLWATLAGRPRMHRDDLRSAGH